ncbi:MAG TPA: hypothetical protein VFR33_01630, partial [Candidatus Dormibacteraeota bacterium]|nr:hypothetical protein [Candidatus Dormibacteraeota bacterium]
MDHPVVFDAEPVLGIAQVDASGEAARFVVDRDLHFWPGQACGHDQHAKAGLHRRLRSRLGKTYHPAENPDAVASRVRLGPRLQLTDVCQALVQSFVGNHYRFNEAQR